MAETIAPTTQTDTPISNVNVTATGEIAVNPALKVNRKEVLNNAFM